MKKKKKKRKILIKVCITNGTAISGMDKKNARPIIDVFFFNLASKKTLFVKFDLKIKF